MRMRRLLLASTLAAVLAGAGWAAGRTSVAAAKPERAASATAASACGTPCQAAYEAIAKALPDDRGNSLARAILRTPGFDYPALSRALHIPTLAQIDAQWRRRCNTIFPDDRRLADACYRMILPSTYRHLDMRQDGPAS